MMKFDIMIITIMFTIKHIYPQAFKLFLINFFFCYLAFDTNIYGVSMWAKLKNYPTNDNYFSLFHLITIE